MKFIKQLTLIFVFACLVVFISCNRDDGGKTTVDPFQEQANKFINNWVLVADGAIWGEGSLPNAAYNGLTLNVSGDKTGGSYSTNIGTLTDVSTKVWPADGNWQFSSSDGDTQNPAAGWVLRSDDILCAVTVVKDVRLEIRFNIPKSTARTTGIDGDWAFFFEPAS